MSEILMDEQKGGWAGRQAFRRWGGGGLWLGRGGTAVVEVTEKRLTPERLCRPHPGVRMRPEGSASPP